MITYNEDRYIVITVDGILETVVGRFDKLNEAQEMFEKLISFDKYQRVFVAIELGLDLSYTVER